jgi:hypothetical protein
LTQGLVFEVIELLFWCLPIQDFSGSFIEFIFDL